MVGYKLFEMDKEGNLFPLFIDKKEKIEVDKWSKAKNVPTNGYAKRPGFHIGADVPDAPWLKGYDGSDYGVYRSRFSKGKRVWCEVEYNSNHNYDEEVQTLPKKCFIDRVPEDGYYRFREVGKGVWIISSDIKVIRILSEAERKEIMLQKSYDEVAAYRKYKETFEKRMKIA